MTRAFLTFDDVVELHRLQLRRFGGAAGIRDVGLLESAVAQPAAVFSGMYLNPGLFDMTLAVAEGSMAKGAVAEELQRLAGG